MKRVFHSLMLVPLLALVSCGGQNTTTSLEVSKGFAVTNTKFGGGLIISGKNLSTGETFTQGLVDNTSIQLKLVSGTWVFTAIGWDGGGSTTGSEKPFAGKPYCGIVQKAISGTSATVDLSITEATCGTSAFADASPDTSTATPTLRKLSSIITCHSFFSAVPNPNGTQTISDLLINSSTSPSYCDSASIPEDWKSKVKGLTIHALSKTPDQQWPVQGFSSPCLSSTTSLINTSSPNPYTTTYDLRLPLKGVPLSVTIYQETDCTRPIARFDFKEGLLASDPHFDHRLFTSGSDQVRLFLPSSDLRRAISPLAHLAPYFKTSSGTLYLTESSSNTYDFHMPYGGEHQIRIDKNSCPATISGTNTVATPVCTDLGEEILVTFTPNATNGTFTLGTDTYSFLAENTGNMPRYETNKEARRLLGSSTTYTKNRTYFELYDDEDSSYGVLDRIRSMFAGNGAGGVLGVADTSQTFKAACEGLNTEKSIAIFNYERLAFESYKLRIHDSVVSGPNSFTCTNTDLDSTCNVAPLLFRKRMLIWDNQMDIVNPSMVFEFSCDEMLGSMEEKYIDKLPGLIFTAKTKLNWNTNIGNSLQNQRFEVLEQVLVHNSNGVLEEEIRKMSRIQKLSSDNVDIRTYTYRGKFDGTSWKEDVESLQQNLMNATGKLCYATSSATTTDTSHYYIFSGGTAGVLSATPKTSGNTFDDGYVIDSAIPQALGACSGLYFQQTISNTNGGGKFAGTLSMQLSSLNASFPGLFGTTFFMDP